VAGRLPSARITGVRTKLNPTMLNALRAKESGFNFTLTPVIFGITIRLPAGILNLIRLV
jgi:hypothetical protein